MVIKLKIQPNAKRESLEVLSEGLWKLKIRAPAIEGRANERVIEILSQVLGCSASKIRLVSGSKSRLKTFECEAEVSDLPKLFENASWR